MRTTPRRQTYPAGSWLRGAGHVTALVLLVASGLVACTPALDWREVRPDGSGALVLFPCKPSHASRWVRLAGSTVKLNLVACAAADVTYAVAFADVAGPAHVGPTLEALDHTARLNIQAAAPVLLAPLRIRGMTPNPRAGVWRFDGHRPDGRAVQEQMALFVHGTRVFQVTAVGDRLDAQALETFFGALRLPS